MTEFGGSEINQVKADPDKDDENKRTLNSSLLAASPHWMMNLLTCSIVDVSSCPEKLGEIWHLVPIRKWNHVIRRRIRCPIRVSVDFGFYPKLVSHHLNYLIGPISIGILPMGWLWIWHLLISFHVSLWCAIYMEHWISHRLLTTNLVSKIRWLVDQPLILKSGLHRSLLKRHSLIILVRHLWKDKLSRPSIVNVHRRRPCR